MTVPLRTRAPWITAFVAGVAVVALVLVYFLLLRPDADNRPAPPAAAGALSTKEKAAITAAGVETANLLTFRRAHFAADFARALNGTTGALHSDVQKEKSATLAKMTSGKFDLGANVTHTALEGPTDTGSGYLVLVVVSAYQSISQDEPVQSNLEVTVQQVKGTWLASDVESVGLE